MLKAGTVHIHEDDLEIYVRGRLEAAPAAILESHLLECETCREKLARCTGVQAALEDREAPAEPGAKYERSEPRFVVGDEAFLQEFHPLFLGREKVQITDISKNGLGILVQKNIFPGTIVQVRIGQMVQLGEVRYCSPCGDKGYRIGLRLREGF